MGNGKVGNLVLLFVKNSSTEETKKNWKQVNLNPRSQKFFLSYKQIGFQTNRHLQFLFSTPLIDEKSRKKRTLSTTFYWITNNLLVRFSSIRCSLVRVFHVCSLFMSYSIFKQEFLISSRSIPSSHASPSHRRKFKLESVFELRKWVCYFNCLHSWKNNEIRFDKRSRRKREIETERFDMYLEFKELYGMRKKLLQYLGKWCYQSEV